MHAAQRPLPALIDAAAETLATGYGHGEITIALLRVEGYALATDRPVPLQGGMAGHGSQADAAAHRVAAEVFPVSPGSRCGKLTTGRAFGH